MPKIFPPVKQGSEIFGPAGGFPPDVIYSSYDDSIGWTLYFKGEEALLPSNENPDGAPVKGQAGAGGDIKT